MREWIDIKDMPPTESDGKVLICFPDKYPYNLKEPYVNAKHDQRVTIGSYSQFSKRWIVDGGVLSEDLYPTHWMPRPKPPKENGNNENYKELVEQLKKRDLSKGGSLGQHSGLYEVAADAITELLARVDVMEEQLLIHKRDKWIVAERTEWTTMRICPVCGERICALNKKKPICCAFCGAALEDALGCLDSAPTIDPETLPGVQELRKKLEKYEKAEKEGRLVELPASPNSEYYTIEKVCTKGGHLKEKTVPKRFDCEDCLEDCDAEYKIQCHRFYGIEDILRLKPFIGSTILLTREEAKAALIERRE